MKTTLIFFISALAAAAAPSAPDKATAVDAKSKAAAWIKALPKDGFVLKEKCARSGFVGEVIVGSKNTMFVLNDAAWQITLGFKGEVSEKSQLVDLQKQFSYIALDQIPLTDLDLPGWKVRAQTPVSSIRKEDGAVEILKIGDGRITFRVKTHFFAIYGSDPSVLVPADAAAPEGSYFQVRERFNLDLTLDAPFVFGK